MLRSRVLTPGFKLFGGFAAFAFVAAYLFGLGSNLANSDQGLVDSVIGPLTFGWKGGVGDHLGYVVLLGTAAAAGTLAGLILAFRDADPESQAQVTDVEVRPLTAVPHGAAYTPLAVALAGVGLLIGFASSTPLALASIFALVMIALVWTTRAWANRASDDDAANAAMYERLMEPWRVPVMSLVAVGIVVLGVSRLLLAVDKVSSVIVFAGIATVFFVVAAVVASRPKMSRNGMAILVVVAVVIVLASAIIGLVAGQREFKNYAEDHSSLGATPSAQVVPVGETTGESA